MLPVERAPLIINRVAGIGDGDVVAEKLSLIFKEALSERAEVNVEVVTNHQAARNFTAQFMRASGAPAFVVAGGGGGTLRAVIEGICGEDTAGPLPGPERVRVGALRMGSGNVLAKRFGAPRDPVIGLQGLLENLNAGLVAPCCVMRCEVCARLFGIERLTKFEYALALFIRSVYGVLFAASAEGIEIHYDGREERLRLLSGVAMSFPIAALPFKPIVRDGQPAISVFLIPRGGKLSPLLQMFPRRLPGRAHCIRLEKDQRLEIHLTDQDCVTFFLDEDPITTFGRLSLGVAGAIAFVPGPNYVDGEPGQ